MEQYKVVVPIYKRELHPYEKLSLGRLMEVIAHDKITFIKPAGLDLQALSGDADQVGSEEFDPDFFKGIAGYNRLMLSGEFYSRFTNAEYILIYQLDCWIFSDRIEQWCRRGYDYVGAPWLRKPVYDLPVVRQYMEYCRRRDHRKGRPNKQDLYNRVGNGGLSLRKVGSHIAALAAHQDRVGTFLDRLGSHHYNEDVFWATQVPEFLYPDPHEALDFSFDKYPGLSLKLNSGRLPMACHGWYKRKMKRFWRPVIGF